MKKIIRFTILTTAFICLFSVQAQQDHPWKTGSQATSPAALIPGQTVSSYILDEQAVKNELSNTLYRGPKGAAMKEGTLLTFPSPEGTYEAYRVVRTRVLSEGLSAKFPDIRSYKGVSVEHPGRTIYFSLDATGFHGMIRQPGHTWYLNPQTNGSNEIYLASRSQLDAADRQCLTEDNIVKRTAEKTQVQWRSFDDATLRTFRLALACTGEYATYHINQANQQNGSDAEKKAAVLSAMNTTMTRVNGIFENDLAITMEIIDNNEDIIFLDAASDGLTNNDGSALLDEIQPVIDNAIGFDNYDIGHVFSTGGGGIALVASPCTTNKAKGVTGLTTPEDDAFDIDFVAHEMGHQFGATHTFNNSCGSNRTDITAVEPGSGSTIMAYAGICPPDVVGQSDDYFHAISIEQIWQNVTNGNSTCAGQSVIGNTAPSLTEPLDYVIPAGTPFVLESMATDTDGDLLTYCWEQQDNEIIQQPPQSTATEGPVFRSRPPGESPNRYFPAPEALLANNLSPTWEPLPTVSRDLHFSILVRDNNEAGGQTARSDSRIEVVETAAPFSVTSQTEATILEASQVETITWEVGETNLEPVNAAFVDIYLIVDNDLDNPVVIQEDTPNDGSQDVVIPAGITTNNARIMIRGANNIFFALNQATLQVEQSGYAIDLGSLEYEVCQPQDLVIPFTYLTFAGFNETTTFSTKDVSTGLNIGFSSSTATADDTEINITVSGTGNAAQGNNSFTLVASSSGGIIKEYPITVNVFNNTFDQPTLLAPINNTTELLLDSQLSWNTVTNTTSYEVDIATNASFSNIVETASVNNPVYHPANLEGSTQYYWRVRPLNNCGQGNYSETFSFTTIAINSASYENNTVVNIPENGAQVLTTTIFVDKEGDLNKLRVGVDISHTYVQDLTITLTSPGGRHVVLLDQPCGENNDIDVVFDDEGDELTCGSNPAISGTITPNENLDSFKGEPILGVWTLTVVDNFDLDGGSINNFSLEVIINGEFKADEDADGVFDDVDQCPGTPAGSKVDVTGCPVFSLQPTNYLVRTQSESCRNSQDGIIEIGTEENLNYTATLTGNGVNETASFTNFHSFSGLTGGDYELCFTIADEPGYEQCFNITISEPEELSVLSKTEPDAKLLQLELSGSDVYFIELNGVVTSTSESTISLPLQEGLNDLKVSTSKSCQGSYKEEIVVGEVFKIYPNPVSNTLNLITADKNSQVGLSVYSITGQQVWSKKVTTNQIGKAQTDLNGLSSGVYILEINGDKTHKTIKLIKQ